MSPILVHLLPHSWPQDLVLGLWQLAFIWFGLMYYLFLLQMRMFLLSGLLCLAKPGKAWFCNGRATALTVLLLAVAIVCCDLLQGRRVPTVARYEFTSPQLESSMDIVFG
ncbi:MAG: hypothetical protein ACOC3Y_04665 [Desulfohalobiaceae bacterium]